MAVNDMRCDRCEEQIDGARLTVTTEATDETGVNVELAKRWVLCRDCGERLAERLGEASPWVDDDFKTIVLPDEEDMSQDMGGYATRPR